MAAKQVFFDVNVIEGNMISGASKWLLIVWLTVATGCSEMAGYPERPKALRAAELEKLETLAYNEPSTQPAGLTAEQWRNQQMNDRLAAIDGRFARFEEDIVVGRQTMNVGTDLAVIGLGSAAAFSGGDAARVMGAVAAGLVGGRGVIDKEVFYDKTMPVLIAQMEANRSRVLLDIRKQQQKVIGDYDLHAGLADVEKYYNAGTLLGAQQEITAQAGAEKTKNDEERRKIEVPILTPELSALSRKIGDKLVQLHKDWGDAGKKAEAAKSALDAASVLKIESTDPDDILKKINDMQEAALTKKDADALQKIAAALKVQ